MHHLEEEYNSSSVVSGPPLPALSAISAVFFVVVLCWGCRSSTESPVPVPEDLSSSDLSVDAAFSSDLQTLDLPQDQMTLDEQDTGRHDAPGREDGVRDEGRLEEPV